MIYEGVLKSTGPVCRSQDRRQTGQTGMGLGEETHHRGCTGPLKDGHKALGPVRGIFGDFAKMSELNPGKSRLRLLRRYDPDPGRFVSEKKV